MRTVLFQTTGTEKAVTPVTDQPTDRQKEPLDAVVIQIADCMPKLVVLSKHGGEDGLDTRHRVLDDHGTVRHVERHSNQHNKTKCNGGGKTMSNTLRIVLLDPFDDTSHGKMAFPTARRTS